MEIEIFRFEDTLSSLFIVASILVCVCRGGGGGGGNHLPQGESVLGPLVYIFSVLSSVKIAPCLSPSFRSRIDGFVGWAQSGHTSHPADVLSICFLFPSLVSLFGGMGNGISLVYASVILLDLCWVEWIDISRKMTEEYIFCHTFRRKNNNIPRRCSSRSWDV